MICELRPSLFRQYHSPADPDVRGGADLKARCPGISDSLIKPMTRDVHLGLHDKEFARLFQDGLNLG